MVSTILNLPEGLYAQAQAVCARQQTTLEALAIKGLEQLIRAEAEEPTETLTWELLSPRPLGWNGLSDTEVKAAAQFPEA